MTKPTSVRVAEIGLLEKTGIEKFAKVGGRTVPMAPEPGWRLTDAGRHNLATRATGSTARDMLDQIEAGE